MREKEGESEKAKVSAEASNLLTRTGGQKTHPSCTPLPNDKAHPVLPPSPAPPSDPTGAKTHTPSSYN